MAFSRAGWLRIQREEKNLRSVQRPRSASRAMSIADSPLRFSGERGREGGREKVEWGERSGERELGW